MLSGVLPAVVGIDVGLGGGSGFFVAPGLVVTNRHVIAGVTEVTVRTSDGKERPAKVYVRARDFDLALVQLYGAPPPHALLPLATLADVRVGQEVVAVGSPLGLQNTVTRGIVSAVRTEAGVTLIQSDAAINPGNSGGPLVDRRGRVVGVTTQVRKLVSLGRGGPVVLGESLGFAIASDHVRALVDGKLASTPFAPESERDPLEALRADLAEPAPQAPAEPSTAEAMRADGEQILQARVEQLAKFAAGIDSLWAQYQASCPEGRAASPRDVRPWLKSTPPTAGFEACGTGLVEVRRRADQLKTAMGTVEEDARRAGVLPGRVRELRARYGLEW